MKIFGPEFVAWRDADRVCHVHYNGAPLNPRFDLRNHSPDGFEWGYGGSGPAQLALAICAAAFGDDVAALEMYQSYKSHLIAGITVDNWRLPVSEVLAWAEDEPKFQALKNRN